LALGEVEGIRGGHFEEVGMQELPVEGLLRHRDRSVDEAWVPNTRIPAMMGDLVFV